MIVLWWWLAGFGIWPLAHPAHNTFSNPVTWMDWTLHLVGWSALLAGLFHAIRRLAAEEPVS